MRLGSCLSGIIHRDITITRIVISPSCLEMCNLYEPDEEDDVDSIEAEENSVNGRIFDLNSERFGSREWFEVLGGMIAKLTNLKKLTLDGIDPENRYLERFWGEVCESKSLTSFAFANMNLEHSADIFCVLGAPNIRKVAFIDCILDEEIGYNFREYHVDHYNISTLHFERCRVTNTSTMKGVGDFVGHLVVLPSLTSVHFISCDFDDELSSFLVRFFREERVRLGLGLVQINLV